MDLNDSIKESVRPVSRIRHSQPKNIVAIVGMQTLFNSNQQTFSVGKKPKKRLCDPVWPGIGVAVLLWWLGS